jgi:hypothetical protein
VFWRTFHRGFQFAEPYVENEVRYQLTIDRYMRSRVPIGLAHGKPALGVSWGSRGRRWFGSGIIDFDSHSLLTGGLLYLQSSGQSGGSFMLTNPSPRRPNAGTF